MRSVVSVAAGSSDAFFCRRQYAVAAHPVPSKATAKRTADRGVMALRTLGTYFMSSLASKSLDETKGRGNIWVPLFTQSTVRGRRLSQRPTYPIRLGRPPYTAKSDPERSPVDHSRGCPYMTKATTEAVATASSLLLVSVAGNENRLNRWCFRHQLLLSHPYLLLTKALIPGGGPTPTWNRPAPDTVAGGARGPGAAVLSAHSPVPGGPRHGRMSKTRRTTDGRSRLSQCLDM